MSGDSHVHLRPGIRSRLTLCGMATMFTSWITRKEAEQSPESVTCPLCRELLEAGE